MKSSGSGESDSTDSEATTNSSNSKTTNENIKSQNSQTNDQIESQQQQQQQSQASSSSLSDDQASNDNPPSDMKNFQKHVDHLISTGIEPEKAHNMVKLFYECANVNTRQLASQMLSQKKFNHIVQEQQRQFNDLKDFLMRRQESQYKRQLELYNDLAVNLKEFRHSYAKQCNEAETSLELDVNNEKKRMAELQRAMDEKVKTIPYYMDKKIERVGKKFQSVKTVARVIPYALSFAGIAYAITSGAPSEWYSHLLPSFSVVPSSINKN